MLSANASTQTNSNIANIQAMDSFELLSQLSNLLTSLNSSKQSSIDLCNFLVRNYVAQEDLYPTILQILPKLDINKRLNILQFLDDFVSMIMKEKKYKDNDIIFNYVFLIISDLHKILQNVLPEYPQPEANSELSPENKEVVTNIRVLANLPFCYKIVQHISKIFDLKNLSEFESLYHSNLLSDADLEKIKEGIPFDASFLYTKIEPTKSSHVDDYLNSREHREATEAEENYIPQKIDQGLVNAWNFLIQKRKQSQYESLLIDLVEDPFNLKLCQREELTIEATSPPKMDSVKTPFKTPSKTPGRVNVLPSSQPPSSKGNGTSTPAHILSLSHSLILQRIEADRERQKRGKETLWEIERKSGKIDISEFEYVYETTQCLDSTEDKLVTDELESLYELCTLNELNLSRLRNQQHRPNESRNNNHQGFKERRNLEEKKPNGEHYYAKDDTSKTMNPRHKPNRNGKSDPPYYSKNNNKTHHRPYEKDDLFYGQQPNKRPHYDEYYNESEWYPNNPQNTFRNKRRPRK